MFGIESSCERYVCSTLFSTRTSTLSVGISNREIQYTHVNHNCIWESSYDRHVVLRPSRINIHFFKINVDYVEK